MANTYTLIASNTLSSSAASVTFSSIPNTYNDLVLRCSTRDTINSYNYTIAVGGAAGSYSETVLFAETTTPGSTSTSNTDPFGTTSYLLGNASGDTANTFGSAEMYLPNYTSSTNKPVSIVSVRERNIANGLGLSLLAGLVRYTSAVSSITIASAGSSFEVGSSFFLYGIKNS